MRKILVGGIGLAMMVFLGVSQPCLTPVDPAAPQVVGRVHCNEILSFIRQTFPDAKYPGVTQEWFDILAESEYLKISQIIGAVRQKHVWIVLGDLKKWHPPIAAGWAFDANAQRDLLVIIAGLPGNLRVMLYDPEIGFVSTTGRRIFLIRI